MNETLSTPTAAPLLAKSDQNLVWLDCEMTGLDAEKERIIEIAVIVTGPQLTPRIEGPVLVIHQSDAVLNAMDSWNTSTHGRTGLTAKVKASTLNEAQAEEQVIAFLSQYVSKGVSPMCGNTIGQDRRFLLKYMPRLELVDAFKKRQSHTALADVHESIDELEHYRAHFMRADA